jgi:hypothetical protein
MRRVIKKRIRRSGEGVDIALDLNADVAINVGGAGGRDRRTAQAGEPPRPPAGDPGERKGSDQKGRKR